MLGDAGGIGVTVRARSVGDVSVIDLEGNLTGGGEADALRQAVGDLLKADRRRIIINMQQARFIDSSGLGELLACKKLALEKGGDVKLLRASGKVHGVLVDARLTRVFETFSDEAIAVGSF